MMLDIKQKYTYVDCNYNNSICENCNKPITNVYIISDGIKNYKVGCECIKGLLGDGFNKDIEVKTTNELRCLKLLVKSKLVRYSFYDYEGLDYWNIECFDKSLSEIYPNTHNSKMVKLVLLKTNNNILEDIKKIKYAMLLKDLEFISYDDFTKIKYLKEVIV